MTMMPRLVSVSALVLALGGAACSRSGSPPQAQVAPPFEKPPTLATGALDVATLAEKVKPTVVNITATRASGPNPFGFERGERKALGTGFIVDPRGTIVTNAHVVEAAEAVRVRLFDGTEHDAKVKGTDPRLDLAVLQVSGVKDLPAVSLGVSGSLRVGEYVVAVGNPFGLDHTVTMGIVSAKGRAIGAGPYDDFIQTDASINPGNSGGPLFDVRGRVVGINTAINPEGKGIGFAIPVDALKDVLPQLVEKGFVTRGKLGVAIQEVDGTLAKALGLEGAKGALVAGVEKDGPGQHAGLKPGDVIVSVDGTKIDRSQELPRTIARHAPGSKVSLDVVRDGKHQTLTATLEELKEKHVALDEPGSPTRGRLGVGVADDDEGGARITHVAPKSAASAAGLHPGDVIVEIDGKKIEDAVDLKKRMGEIEGGKAVVAKVRRGDAVRWIGIDLG